MAPRGCTGVDTLRGNEVVGAARFELTTSASQTRRSTRLSYAPVHGRTLVDSRKRIKNFLEENFHTWETPAFDGKILRIKTHNVKRWTRWNFPQQATSPLARCPSLAKFL